MLRKILPILMAWLMVGAASCDKLEDSDVTAETLAGRWAFSYKSSEPLSYELSYRIVTFQPDGSCSLVYEGGQLAGTFRASQDVIRIDSTTDDGNEHTLLWRVESMSPRRIVALYDHELSSGKTITLTVTLDKL